MITNVPLQWALSAIFILITAYPVVWIVRSSNTRDRISNATHALMGVSMFAMVWRETSEWIIVQVVVFTLATLWFLLLIREQERGPGADNAHEGHHDSVGRLGYHAGMMAAMVGMTLAMAGFGTAPASGDLSMGSMPGMDMSGGTDISGLASPVWVTVVSVVCSLGFAVAVLYFIRGVVAAAVAPAARTHAGRHRAADATWNLLMAAGMLALFLPLTSLG